MSAFDCRSLALARWPRPACTKGETAQARGRDEAAKPVKVEAGRRADGDPLGRGRRHARRGGRSRRSRPRPTASSAKILADLGDRVHAGDVLVELDREKARIQPRRSSAPRSPARWRSTARPIRSICRRSRRRPTCRRRAPSSRRRSRPSTAPASCTSAARAAADARRCRRRRCSRSRRATTRRCRTRRTCGANIDAADAAMKLADRQLRDTYIRAPFDGYVQKRLRQPRRSFVKGSARRCR